MSGRSCRGLVNIVMIMVSVKCDINMFRTKFAAALTENEDIAEKVIETVPLGRFGEASQQTDVLFFVLIAGLVSPQRSAAPSASSPRTRPATSPGRPWWWRGGCTRGSERQTLNKHILK